MSEEMVEFMAVPIDNRISILETMPRLPELSNDTKTALKTMEANNPAYYNGFTEDARAGAIWDLTDIYNNVPPMDAQLLIINERRVADREKELGFPPGSFHELIAYSTQELLNLSKIEKDGINTAFEDASKTSGELGNAINELSAEIVREGTKRDGDTLYGFLSWDKSKEFPLSSSTLPFFTSRDGSGHTHLLPPEAIVSITNDMLASVVAESVPQLRSDMAEFAKNNKMVFDAHDFNLGIIELKTVLPKILDEKLER